MWHSRKKSRFDVAMALVLMLVATICFLTAGCATTPSCIDPSGERIFARPTAGTSTQQIDDSNELYRDSPGGQLPWDDVIVLLEPREQVARVGTEVILVAGVGGASGFLHTNRRLEWTIGAGSVGNFVDIGKNGFVDLMLGDFTRPRIISNTYAVGSTGRTNIRLNRGTEDPGDDVYVLRGQGWVSVTSSVEGDSLVTVVAPDVYGWDARMKTATIHWVDAQWRFPPPAINPAGTKHVFTTTVVRQTNQAPCEKWRVRYEILDGPPAGFSPDGAQVIEVPTDSAGQASAEIFQREPKHGTNRISIQVIRPGDVPGGNGQRLIVGCGTTMKTWTAADLSVKISGPSTASPGATLPYRIDVSNPGDLTAKDVVATIAIPEGLTYISSNPPAESSGREIRWRLGDLGARQQRVLEIGFRTDRQGSITTCCEVTAAGGLKVRDCATTTAIISAIDVQVTGPSEASVGSQATFEIIVKNQSPLPATDLIIKDRLDSGFQHPAAEEQNAIKKSLGTLAPGEIKRIKVTLRVVKGGQQCHTVEVSGRNIPPVTARACLNAIGDTTTQPDLVQPRYPARPDGAQPAPATITPRSAISVKMTGPKKLQVGETAQFIIEIRNTGQTNLQKLKIIDQYDNELSPTMATGGYDFQPGRRELSWTVEELSAGKAIQLGLHCTCQAAALRACNRISVTAIDGTRSEAEACLEIAAPPSEVKPATPPDDGMTFSVVGLRNPVAAGREFSYEIVVTNISANVKRQVLVTATIPEGMVAAALGTTGPGKTGFTIEGKTVRFDPVFEMQPGESLRYVVRVLAKQPGKYSFKAELLTTTLKEPLVRETTTEIIPSASR